MLRTTHALLLVLVVAVSGLLWWTLAARGRGGAAPVAEAEVPAEEARPAELAEPSPMTAAPPEEESRRVVETVEPASEPAEAPEPPAEAEPTRGLVVDPFGAPVAQATVHELDARRRRAEERTTTGADGSFAIERRERLARVLAARHPDWVTSEAVVLDPGDEPLAEPLVLRLRRGGRVSGRVVDERGEPSPSVMQVKAEVRGPFRETPRPLDTDADGRFVVERVVPGPALLLAYPPEMHDGPPRDDAERRARQERTVVQSLDVVEGGEYEVELVRHTPEPVTVFGRVLGPDGPLAGRDVHYFRLDAWVSGVATRSGDDGRYEVRLPYPGTYAVAVDVPDPERRPTGPDETALHVTVPPSRQPLERDLVLAIGSLVGSVVRVDGAPLDRSRVVVVRDEPWIAPGWSRVSDVVDGRFEATDVPAGTYRLSVLEADRMGTFGPFDVVAGATTDVGEVELEPMGFARVVIRDEAGRPVSGAVLGVFDAEGRPPTPVPLRIPSGSTGYLAYAPAGGSGYVLAWTPEGAVSPAVRFDADRDASTTVELALAPGSRLVVEATEGGRPIAAGVQVFDANGVRVSDTLSVLGHRRTLHEPGAFFEPLPPGTYTVRARSWSGGVAEGTVTVEPDVREVRLALALD